MSWTLFGIKRLVLLAHTAIKTMMTCSRVLDTAMVNSAIKCHRAYTQLTHEDDDFDMGSIDTELDHTEDDISTYLLYLTNLFSPSPSHTSKVFLPKSIWNELTDKVKPLIITQNKNVVSLSLHSPATLSPTSHTLIQFPPEMVEN